MGQRELHLSLLIAHRHQQQRLSASGKYGHVIAVAGVGRRAGRQLGPIGHAVGLLQHRPAVTGAWQHHGSRDAQEPSCATAGAAQRRSQSAPQNAEGDVRTAKDNNNGNKNNSNTEGSKTTTTIMW